MMSTRTGVGRGFQPRLGGPQRAALLKACATAVIILAGSYAGRAFQARQDGGPERATLQLATIKQYCATCHNDRTKAAGVSFEGLTAADIGARADVFEKAV